MTTSETSAQPRGRTLPVLAVTLALLALWYLGAVALNAPGVADRMRREGRESLTLREVMEGALAVERPVLPAPHQILAELSRTVIEVAPTSRRSLVYHSWITLSAALLGFAFGSFLGIALAVGIVHLRTLRRSLLPWIIASQTVPILAIAPMIIVVLGSLGFQGLVPKAIISAYLCFFPVTIGMVKGLTSAEHLHLDLMATYNASGGQVFWKLRWPSAVHFLFASLKIAVALAMVGAIVGELPTGAQAGLGARLLSGSYYGQTQQIWAALVAAALLAGTAVALVGMAERVTLGRMGGQP
jgi:NitT/TauT family transport system permease protein